MINLFSTKVAYASVDSFVMKVNQLIINPLITLIFALALAYFLYGVLEFLMNQNNEERKTAGKSHMLWGIVGLTVMMGVWAMLGIILNTFNLTDQIDLEQGEVNLNDYNPSYPPGK